MAKIHIHLAVLTKIFQKRRFARAESAFDRRIKSPFLIPVILPHLCYAAVRMKSIEHFAICKNQLQYLIPFSLTPWLFIASLILKFPNLFRSASSFFAHFNSGFIVADFSVLFFNWHELWLWWHEFFLLIFNVGLHNISLSRLPSGHAVFQSVHL